ncbi:UDP-N-acetylmuramoyl-L-alanyl-D-glutamate--2,6-diaminopimelate ligase [Candidatus Arthromitus sp. SFB-rat-Yit]|uniref:UDP-N-acetylmuramoyl-L-alanyl-D-glutamate--2, 6-diaminopimelate ligase n=1 Tax=Candidatus Arthromitus sp. SFB-rat-Yit TaxID=1041504 RepID=UPI000227A0FF|nr:UDP-N-acetylmuramoyl-L-alanyl-D-glutamate--2,6-diaminopimelate ligase [Candidatus Arthromitus sp. SFB-rat-Yit]BAK81321.1 UDP-N-acetylmuramoylalanyl-D-glutamate--2,6-diaminopimelate ligase [Candidatus Arthromitus sp. SFB-rat-Yit]
MKVSELFKSFDYRVISGNDDVDINKITDNTNDILDGDLFFCIRGYNFDGHNFIDLALSKGSKVIVVDSKYKLNFDFGNNVTLICVNDTRKALSIAAINFYGRPHEKFKILGVTGTNGKTTTTYILREIFSNAGFKTGVIGTISNFINDRKIKAEGTTPGALQLNYLLSEMVKDGVEYCFMEVSSHALELDRVYGIKFDYGIFTNLTQDHLDFHKNFSEYFNAKFKLFENSERIIINRDDEYGKKIIDKIPSNVITYGIEENMNDFVAKDIVLNDNSTEFVVCDKFGNRYNFDYNLVGKFNVYNAIPCIAIAINEGISINVIKESLKNIFVVGRLENVSKKYGLNCDIYLDYAHTPDGLKNCICTLRNIAKGRIICVVGCGGDRDKEKRPQIGKIATELSDYVYITSDNPRSEDPESIINDIVSGVNKSNYEVVISRFDAIKKSIKNRKTNDIILIAGKGHEDYQILKNKVIHFDEREVIDEILKEK